ncbi:MAG TPA: twin-arginine translocase TatA/TatE family subunit [Acidimicrobiales bacterium]|nr:twin-arginine translocase TatA/TatE family subunit [Acidimicrobiales bacterium]
MLLGEIFGPDLMVVIVIVAVVIFGGSAIPKLARSLGQARHEFHAGVSSKSSGDAAAEPLTPKE